MVQRPQVSVLMSTYNRADQLRGAVESVLAQEAVRFELLIVNDCSNDGTADLLAVFDGDERIRIFENATNRGLPASLNRAIDESRAQLLARIDDDDRWNDPQKLSRQLQWLEAHPDTVLLGTGYIDEAGRTIHNPAGDRAIRRQLLWRCPFCHPSVVMRKAAVEEAGGFDETLPYAEDWDLWLRMGQLGRLANLPAVTLIKREADQTLSRRYFKRQLRTASDFARRYADAYPGAVGARVFHRFNRLFFSIFPVQGRVHRAMGRAFRRVFRLDGDQTRHDR